ncbi:MAG: ROK family transcriptional regulator [Chloroflexota bacterium]
MASQLLGANLPQVKRQNRSLVLRILLHHGPISRTEICQMTRLTPATISNVIGELQESGLVLALGTDERPATPRLGRRRLMVDLNARGGFAVGVYLGVRSLQVGIGDLRGRVLGKITVPAGRKRSSQAVLELVREQLQRLLAETQVPLSRVCGLGLGSVGLVNSASGEIVELPQYGWHNVAAKVELEAALGLPVAVDNSRRAMATAEAWLGRGQGEDGVLLIHVATTIGGAMVYQREVLHGANYAAGQLGHLIVVENGPPCSCGRSGCLDTVASGAAMIAAANAAAREGRSPGLAARGWGEREEDGWDSIFAAAEAGDEVARQLVARSAHYVGVGLAHWVSLFDPRVVVLTGGIAWRGGEEYRRQVAATANARAYRTDRSPIELHPSSFGSDLEIVGPLSLALREFVYSSSESWALGAGNGRKAQPLERLVASA